jgi:hypothetical protein
MSARTKKADFGEIRRFTRQTFNKCAEILDAMDSPEFAGQPAPGAAPIAFTDFGVRFSKRMTSSFGSAGRWNGQYKIKISVPRTIEIFEQNSEEKAYAILEDTLTHEYAHMVDMQWFGRSSHGTRWQQIHKALGGSGETYGSIYGNLSEIRDAVIAYIEKAGRTIAINHQGSVRNMQIKRLNQNTITGQYKNGYGTAKFRAGYSWFYKKLDLASQIEEETPAEQETAEEGPELSPHNTDLCSKARIYFAWKAGEKSVNALLELVDHDVKASSVKQWIRRWKKGRAFPKVANR